MTAADPITADLCRSADRWEKIRAVSLPILVGLLVGATLPIGAGFPLTDGGLFYAMAEDIHMRGSHSP